ncbi:MAG: hypothetical protein UT02_C0023G0005 [Parcubacteria group bacterium GW2011_GWC2_38_7]|nr:MAG: hypothetical protein UT02_C0023G0005 [Parcubacteria group bacterium GW2011_GWC2_38_7]
MTQIIEFLKKNWQTKLLILFIIVMVVPYCYLSLTTGHKFYSPDETANFVFTKNFVENSNLQIDIELNKQVENVIFPRSVNVIAGHFVPMSFLGLPIFYGLIGKIIGINLVTFITPLLSLLAVFIFYLIIKEIFNKNIAFLSGLFLLFNPVYWYLAGKAMLHNNLFVFFVILGLWLLLLALRKSNSLIYGLAAIVFGLSIWARTSEIVWVGLLMLIFYIVNRKNVKAGEVGLFVVGFCGMVGLLLYVNYLTYDNIFRSGYSSLESQSSAGFSSLIAQIILPFGFKIKNIAFHVWEFFIKYLWFITLPALWGFIYFCKKGLSKLQKFYVYSTGIVSLYLLTYYGSYWPWGEYGQPSTPEVLIGSPHLRYWLPVLILATPFMAIFLIEFLPRLFKLKKIVSLIPTVAFLILLLSFSVATVFYNPQEGFAKIRYDISDFGPRLTKVEALVEPEAILIVPDWADRIFFPEYQVIHSLGDKAVYAGDAYSQIEKLIQLTPIYYYSADSSDDIASLKVFLTRFNIKLEYLTDVFKDEKLYKVIYDSNN